MICDTFVKSQNIYRDMVIQISKFWRISETFAVSVHGYMILLKIFKEM